MKSRPIFIIAAIFILMVLGIIWIFYEAEVSLNSSDLIQAIILIILVVFALLIISRRIISGRKGQPPEDEMSKNILQKAASTSFYISLYMWLVISYVSNTVDIRTQSLFGYGIVGMAIMFAISWLFYRFRGVSDV
jgi:peptidoglycan/LPS O-acetylase OafA/YrhL